MLIVKVKKGDNIERALKVFKRKVNSTKLIKELNERREYVKPSVKNRQKRSNAIYKQRMKLNEE